MNGWLKYISSPKSQQSVVFAYTRFEELLRAFANSDLLPFSEKSADEFDRQRGLGCRIGTVDLRVASIAISHGMTGKQGQALLFLRVGTGDCVGRSSRD